jgi:phosphatidylglycerophosphatase A
MRGVVVVLATWGGCGFSPFAPGTVGTLGAIPLYLLLARLPLAAYLGATLLLTVLACWVAGRAQEIYGEHDPGKIVIDEVAGYLVTMAGMPLSWQGVVAGFFLFRLFDIVKPPPARLIDQRLTSGTGVVLDDIVAGLYACACLHLLARFL